MKGSRRATVSARELVAALGAIVPSSVVPYADEDAGQWIESYPAERRHVQRAVEARQREFALGRACARAALRRLGHADAVIPASQDRSPEWPTGFCGSISHTDGLAAAVAARSGDHAALGLDIERTGRVAVRLWPSLFVADELGLLQGSGPDERDSLATALFSAKEAYYKAQFAIHRRWLGFHDVRIRLDGAAFEAMEAGAARPPARGRIAWLSGLVATFTAL